MKAWARWFVPVAVAGTVATGAVVSSAAAGRAPDVPAADVADVLARVADSDVTAFSGTVSSRSDLGLPAVPGVSSSGSDAAGLALRLLSGDSTVRVWADGPQRQRAQVLDEFAQLDVVHSGRDVWTWSSADDTATRTVLPDPAALPRTDRERPDPTDLPTPQALAEQLLAADDPTTEVSLGTPTTVAGRPTWTLLVTPRTTETLVAQAQVAVDTATGLPLRVQVVARGQEDPAVDVGFRSLDLSTPDADVFAFTPPQGATVTTTRVPVPTAPAPGSRQAPTAPDGERPQVLGEGWTTVVSARVDPAALAQADPSLLDALTTRVDGGRAVRTALLTVLLTDDGRVLAGAVPLATLQRLAG